MSPSPRFFGRRLSAVKSPPFFSPALSHRSFRFCFSFVPSDGTPPALAPGLLFTSPHLERPNVNFSACTCFAGLPEGMRERARGSCRPCPSFSSLCPRYLSLPISTGIRPDLSLDILSASSYCLTRNRGQECLKRDH